MTPQEQYKAILSQKIISNLKKRNITGYYCKNKTEALQKALEIIPKGSTIAWGGSQSIKEIGLLDAIRSEDYTLYDRDKAATPAEAKELFRQAFSCNYYLSGTNAITLDGELVNIDGNGNRVAAMIYGPDHVLLIVGMNKITKDETSARERIRNYASPLNAIRLECNTPCKTTGICQDCLGNTICCQMVTTRFSREADRITVILVGENLGY